MGGEVGIAVIGVLGALAGIALAAGAAGAAGLMRWLLACRWSSRCTGSRPSARSR
jgi:hypothetical protein